MRAGYWSERSLRSYGCSYFSSDFFGDAVISVVERFQESAKQEEAAFHKLLSRRTHISGAAKQEQPKHLSRAWLFMLPHLNNGDTGSALNRSLQSVKWVWGPLLLLLWKLRWRILTPVGSGQWGPPEVVNISFTVSFSLRCPQGTVLPTLPPCVLQGAAVSGERISQGPPGNVVALECPPPPRRIFRAVSSDASCRYAVSGRCSDCTTRQSVAYRAPPPKYGDTGSVLNRSLRSVKWIWGPLLFLRGLRERKPNARGIRPMFSNEMAPQQFLVMKQEVKAPLEKEAIEYIPHSNR